VLLATDTLKKHNGDSFLVRGLQVLADIKPICSDLSLIASRSMLDRKVKEGEVLNKIVSKQVELMEFLLPSGHEPGPDIELTFSKTEILKYAKDMGAEEFKVHMLSAIKADIENKMQSTLRAIALYWQSEILAKQLLEKERQIQTAFEQTAEKLDHSICLVAKIAGKARSFVFFFDYIRLHIDARIRFRLADMNHTADMLTDTLTEKNNYTEKFLANQLLEYFEEINYSLLESSFLVETYLNVFEKYILEPFHVVRATFSMMNVAEQVIQRSLPKVYFNYCQKVLDVQEEARELVNINHEEFLLAVNNTQPEEEIDWLVESFDLS